MTRVPLDVAANIAEVQVGTIRQWVARGIIRRYPDGYDLMELLHWIDTLRRNEQEQLAVIEKLTKKMEAPDYDRQVFSAPTICNHFRQFRLTAQTISNWVARGDRTGVRKYPGGYDPNEILRWLVRRGERKTRRDRAS